jgi:histidinol dehydrogenase
MSKRLKTTDSNFTSQFDDLVSAKREADSDVSDSVKQIISDVKERGDEAVIQ